MTLTLLYAALGLAMLLNLYSALTFCLARRRMEANAKALERDYQRVRADVTERLQHLLREFMANPTDPRWWPDDPGKHVH